jgi:hypothetical protein
MIDHQDSVRPQDVSHFQNRFLVVRHIPKVVNANNLVEATMQERKIGHVSLDNVNISIFFHIFFRSFDESWIDVQCDNIGTLEGEPRRVPSVAGATIQN